MVEKEPCRVAYGSRTGSGTPASTGAQHNQTSVQLPGGGLDRGVLGGTPRAGSADTRAQRVQVVPRSSTDRSTGSGFIARRSDAR